MKRPHIIIFNPDEMRWDTMGHMGNPAARTPFLDSFAKNEAVSFENAYCQNPVCVPSRCSFLTGLYPHVRGHRSMGHLLHPDESTLFLELKNAGYHVWMNDRNDLIAGQIPGLAESHSTDIYYSGARKTGPGPQNPNYRGEPDGPAYYSHLEGKLSLDSNGINYCGDDEIVDAAIEFLKKPPLNKPICMFLGLFYPHPPYRIEDPFYSSISPKDLPPRVRASDCEGKSLMLDMIRDNLHMEAFGEDNWDELRRVYLGMCSKIDHLFQKLVNTLKEQGIYDDCAIFFLSDHGDFAGDYDLVEKAQNSFEDCLVRVPFLIKPPKGYGVDPGPCKSLVELVDFYATAMDYAGVTPDHTHFGRSLKGVVADRNKEHRDMVFSEGGRLPCEQQCSEYYGKNGSTPPSSIVYYPKMKAQADDKAHSKAVMARNGKYKFVSRLEGPDELYDLEKDPKEKVNIIEAPGSDRIARDFEKRMLKWFLETGDTVPLEPDLRFTPKMMFARAAAVAPEKYHGDIERKIDEGMSFIQLMTYARSLSEKEV